MTNYLTPESPHQPKAGWVRFHSVLGMICTDSQLQAFMDDRKIKPVWGWVVGEEIDIGVGWTPVLLDEDEDPTFIKTWAIKPIGEPPNA